MKSQLLLLLAIALLTGCAGTQRIVTDAAAGAGGAAIGHELSHGNAWATAGGAAAGVAVGEGVNYLNQNATQRARADGYNNGRSDAVKQQYWVMVNQQKAAEGNPDEKISLYDIPIPEQQIDGVNLKPTTKTLRIEE
jgi:hypothetical protein